MHDRTGYLSSCEGLAHGADGLSILVRLFLHLQQLRGLDQRLQGLLGSTVHQAFVSEPLLQLAHVVPVHARAADVNTPANTASLWRSSLCSDISYLICMPLLQEHMSLRSSRLLRVTAPMM